MSAFAAAALAGCGSDDEPCDPVANTGCGDGLACEQVTDGEPACFSPVVVSGDVFALVDGSAIEGARVVAVDINGAAVTTVAISSDSGAYELAVPSTRDADGVPVPVELTLRAAAADFQTFPGGVRQALPVDTSVAVEEDGRYVVQSSLTSIGLSALPTAADGSIAGTVELPGPGAGALVVAEDASGVGYSAVADLDGDYVIFNVPDGDYTVNAYVRGASHAPADVNVSGDSLDDIDLALSDAATGTVSGNVQIVNAPGEAATSVILAVESTFDEVLARGQTVPGMRAPDPGFAPNVTGDYVLEGVPAGDYVILAAFENDALVRDPDQSIAGTSLLRITVAPGETTVVDGFKVTEALEVFGPGATGPEAVDATPTLRWADDSSETGYSVVVFDSFGEVVWETEIDGTSGSDPEVQYAGPALESGVFYQFRATSTRDTGPISQTEDLAGVFFVE